MLSGSQITPAHRKTSAQKHISSLTIGDVDMSNAHYVATFPPLVHVFTHLKLTMHSYHYKITLDGAQDIDLTCNSPPARKWVNAESMGNETLSTGMRKCWDLVAKEL